MSLILTIDTALSEASVALSQDGRCTAVHLSENPFKHAEFVHVAVQELCRQKGLQLQDIDAVAVTAGPGSYTGLRVGMASAKGFAYALSKPLIAINTLEVMACRALQTLSPAHQEIRLFCPMIDARRMEVFCAIYDRSLKTMQQPHARILDNDSFKEELERDPILFFGNGSTKWKDLEPGSQANFTEIGQLYTALCQLSAQRFQDKNFSHLIHSEPFYVKDFYNGAQ